MSQMKPLGLLLATLVLFVLRVQAQGDRFRPDARLGDPSFRGPGPFDYDEEEDEDPNFGYPDDDAGPGPEFPDEDYPEEVDDDEYEDAEFPGYARNRPRPYDRYSSRYGRGPYRRRGNSRDWYDHDDDYFSRSRRKDPYRRYDSDSDDRFNSRKLRPRNRGRGGHRKPHSYSDGGGNSRHGSSSRNKGLSYRGASSSYGSRSQNSESPIDMKEVATRVRKLLGSLRKSKLDKKEDVPSEAVMAM